MSSRRVYCSTEKCFLQKKKIKQFKKKKKTFTLNIGSEISIANIFTVHTTRVMAFSSYPHLYNVHRVLTGACSTSRKMLHTCVAFVIHLETRLHEGVGLAHELCETVSITIQLLYYYH